MGARRRRREDVDENGVRIGARASSAGDGEERRGRGMAGKVLHVVRV